MKILSLSKAQQRVWVEWKLAPTSSAYNNPLLYRLKGEVKSDLIAEALQTVVDAQPALRSYFIEQAGVPKQVLVEKVEVTLAYHDVTGLEGKEKDATIHSLMTTNVGVGFEINQLPLFRFSLIKVASTEYLLILNIHHIVVDGYSASLLIEHISNYYNQTLNASVTHDTRYINYLTDTAALSEDQQAFWIKQFEEANFAADLFTENGTPDIAYDRGKRKHFTLSPKLTKQLKQLAKQNKTTDFLVLMSAFYIVLAKYANQYDLTVGYAIDTRPSDCKSLFGFFVNSIPLRLCFSPHDTFQMVLAKLTQLRKLIKPNQTVDYSDIVRSVRQHTPDAPNALYNVSFIRANFALDGLRLNDIHVNAEPLFTGAVKDDLCLLYDETDTFEFEIEYRLQQYQADYIALIEQSYVACLQAMVDHPSTLIKNVNIYQNATKDTDLITRFVRHVETHPHQIAIVTQHDKVTYQELYEETRSIIHYLMAKQVVSDKPVVVFLDRKPSLLATLLALQWLGIAYIPLDKQTPIERIISIMEESNASAMIVDDDMTIQDFPMISLAEAKPCDRPVPSPVIGKVAYIIYTSGSTGKPKGVVIGNLALSNFLASMAKRFLKESDDLLLAITTIAFDISGLELLLPLWSGRTLYLANQHQYKDPFAIKKILTESPITLLQATPAMWKMLMDVDWMGNENLVALCGGEALSRSLADQLLSRCQVVWNMYGPTEATIWCSLKQIEAKGHITVGQPIENLQFHVLDEQKNPLPPYVKGELYISGIGLAEGYLNRDDLTAAQFHYHEHLKTRLYNTGDIACVNPEGDYIIFGRKDNQVKLNGYRIELGEIESHLTAIPAVKQAAVIVHHHQLITYLSMREAMTDAMIVATLSRALPDYMIPKRYVFLTDLPLSASGKIDRKALPRKTLQRTNTHEPAETLLESQLLAVWKQVLQREHLGVTDHFYEVGGHSLLATQIIAKLQEQHAIYLDINDFFKYMTIRLCANYLETHKKISETIPSYQLDVYPLTHAQKRFWFLSQRDAEGGQFNMAASIQISGPVDKEKLRRALKQLSLRHPILNTVLSLRDDEPVQLLTYPAVLPFDCYSILDLPTQPQAWLSTWAQQSFPLEHALLWRSCLIELSETTYLFGFSMHHLIGDGYSVSILLNHLWSYYQGESVADSRLSYLDYAQWESEQRTETKLYDFWKQELLACPYLQLPTDHARPARYDYTGDQHRWKIEAAVWQSIQRFCQQEKVSVTSFLIACFALLLQRITQLNEFCIGLPLANRDKPELTQLVGCFINLIPLRVIIGQDMTFSEWVSQLHTHIQRCVTQGNVSFAKLLEYLAVPRYINQAPLFNVVINVQPNPFNQAYSADFPLNVQPLHTQTSKYDLTMDLYFDENGLQGYCEYATRLFNESTIVDWCEHFQLLLAQFSRQPDSLLTTSSVNLLPQPSVLMSQGVSTARYPEGAFQKRIALQWEKSLHKTPISLDDNYFSLGGHSLLAAKMIKALSHDLAREIPLEMIFTHPVLEAFCSAISALDEQTMKDLPVSWQEASETLMPLTPNQRQLALLYLTEKSDKYHLGVLVECPPQINLERWQQAIQQVLNQHKIYHWQLTDDGQQAIYANTAFTVQTLYAIHDDHVMTLAKAFVAEPFDFYQAPLIRIAILSRNHEQHYMVVSMHHIIGDEWSLELFIKAIYQQYDDPFSVFAPTPLWQHHLHHWINNKPESLAYWREYAPHQSASRLLPTNAYKKEVNQGQSYQGSLSPTLMHACHQLSQEYGVSLYTVILAVYLIFIKYYTAETTLLIASAYDRRTSSSLQNLHGYLVNLLPVYIDFNGLHTLKDVIDYLNQDRIDSLQHADVDTATLLEMNVINKPDIIFNYQHAFELNEANAALKWQAITSDKAKFPFVFNLRRQGHGGMDCTIDYDMAYYDVTFIEQCFVAFKELLSLLTVNREKKIGDWQLVPHEMVFVDPTYQQPHDNHCFISLLKETATLHAEKIAIDYHVSRLTYAQLWEKVAQLSAAILTYRETVHHQTIAVMMRNSDDYVVTLLAILSLGAAFLPISVDYPADRKAYMLKDSNALFIITDESDDEAASMISFSSLMKGGPLSTVHPSSVSADSPAYLIYTSGTTGTPKGVQINQTQLHQFIHALKQTLFIDHEDKILQFASISFDASIWEIFLALYAGATLCIPHAKQRHVGLSLQQFMQEKAITHALLTPSVLQTLDPSQLTDLRCIASGGESCTAALVEKWADKVAFYNAYGPTEATVCTHLAKMQTNTRANIIGSPLGSSRLQVVSDTLQSLPTGAIGELFIAGDNVTQGYVNQPQLNQSKFITLSQERYYQSGDYVRVLADHQFEYLGRKDRQVKLRGLRIELGEIESALLLNKAVQQAICHVHDQQLLAYIVSDESIETEALQILLAKQLPTFMLPNDIIQLAAIPLSPNGKIDYSSLPITSNARQPVIPPSQGIEQRLHAIWKQYLSLSDLGVNQDFFFLGGNSLQAMQMVASIGEAFSIDMSIQQFYSHSTIAQQAKWIEQCQRHPNDELLQMIKQLSAEEQAALLQIA